MKSHRIQFTTIGVAALLLISGCASNEIKEEDEAFKQQIQQEEQLRQDYADKLKSTQAVSEQDKAEARAEVAALRQDLDRALAENRTHIQKLESLTIIDIQHSVLFRSGEAELSKEGKVIVNEIAEALKQHPGFHMRVEGHTDSNPIHTNLKARYPSNWELSGARAATVVKYMIHALGVPAESLSIAGYANYRPVATNTTEEGRSQNRRIRAVLFKG